MKRLPLTFTSVGDLNFSAERSGDITVEVVTREVGARGNTKTLTLTIPAERKVELIALLLGSPYESDYTLDEIISRYYAQP